MLKYIIERHDPTLVYDELTFSDLKRTCGVTSYDMVGKQVGRRWRGFFFSFFFLWVEWILLYDDVSCCWFVVGVIPIRLLTCQICFFNSHDHPRVKLLDAMLATSAAPSFFPIHNFTMQREMLSESGACFVCKNGMLLDESQNVRAWMVASSSSSSSWFVCCCAISAHSIVLLVVFL
jgi:hypothetical protein